MHGENLSGRVFGKVIVIKPLKKVTNRRKWLCKCACSKEFTRRGTVLLSGKSTGCRSCNNGNLKRPYEGLYNLLCAVALGRDLAVDLSYEEYLTFTANKHCHYCGTSIGWEPHGKFSNGHHLDRKDNLKGYSKKNCVVCCPRCNRAKSNHFTYKEWVQIGALIKSWRMKTRST
jgi:hypothetical protein